MNYYEVNNHALESSDILLDIDSYIKVIDYNIDPFVKDQFWKTVSENLSTHVGAEILSWMGYDNEQVRNRKDKFIKMLKSHNIKFRQVKYKDDDFDKFPEFVEEARVMEPNSLFKQRWLVLDSDDFKMAAMCLRTKRGDNVRRYYINLEKLFHLYTDYSRRFIKNKLNIAVEDRAPLPDNKNKIEKFMLFKLENNNKTSIYYVIRAQRKYCNTKESILRSKYDTVTRLLNLDCAPNSKTLYIRVKEKLDLEGVGFCRNKICIPPTMTEEYLVNALEVISDQKYDVLEQVDQC